MHQSRAAPVEPNHAPSFQEKEQEQDGPREKKYEEEVAEHDFVHEASEEDNGLQKDPVFSIEDIKRSHLGRRSQQENQIFNKDQ